MYESPLNNNDKWSYIHLIAHPNGQYDRSGKQLMQLMDYYGVNNTSDITAEQAKAFYEMLKANMESAWYRGENTETQE